MIIIKKFNKKNSFQNPFLNHKNNEQTINQLRNINNGANQGIFDFNICKIKFDCLLFFKFIILEVMN